MSIYNIKTSFTNSNSRYIYNSRINSLNTDYSLPNVDTKPKNLTPSSMFFTLGVLISLIVRQPDPPKNFWYIICRKLLNDGKFYSPDMIDSEAIGIYKSLVLYLSQENNAKWDNWEKDLENFQQTLEAVNNSNTIYFSEEEAREEFIRRVQPSKYARTGDKDEFDQCICELINPECNPDVATFDDENDCIKCGSGSGSGDESEVQKFVFDSKTNKWTVSGV